MRLKGMVSHRIAVDTKRRTFLRMAVLLLTSAGAAVAQATPGNLHAGARIRLRAPDLGVLWATTGVVDSVGADTLYVRNLRDPPSLRRLSRLAIPLTSVTQLDVSSGEKSRWSHARKGAAWGLAVYGVAAGAFIIRERSTCRGSDCFGEGMAWIGLIGAVPWAAGIGGAIGFSLPVERWRRIDAPLRSP